MRGAGSSIGFYQILPLNKASGGLVVSIGRSTPSFLVHSNCKLLNFNEKLQKALRRFYIVPYIITR